MPRKDEILNEGVYQAALDAGQQQKPTYAGTFDQQLADLYQQISTRPGFEYDVNADPLYQQYKDQYIQQGKLAMRDTMGKAAALTGGYGSTYGQQVGQQTYDAYLQNLSAAIPELYGVAYGKYKDDGDNLLKLYGLVGDQRDTEYGRFRDEMKDWESNREYQRQVENEEYNRRTAEQRASEQRQQQLYSNLYAMIKASGYMPTDAELQAAGMTREAAAAIAAEFQRGVDLENRNQALKEWQIGMQVYGGGGGGSSSGGGGGGGGGYSGGGGGGSDVASIQRQLNAMGANLDVDGIWGPLTEAAYNQYMGGGGGSYTTADIVAGNDNAIAAAAAGYQIANTSGNAASEQEIVDAIDFATGRAKAGSYAYKPNKNARNY